MVDLNGAIRATGPYLGPFRLMPFFYMKILKNNDV